jgi:hypothetical protein
VSEAIRALARIGQIFSKIFLGLAFLLRLIDMVLVRNTFNTLRVGLVPSVVASVVPVKRRFQIVQFVRFGFSQRGGQPGGQAE